MIRLTARAGGLLLLLFWTGCAAPQRQESVAETPGQSLTQPEPTAIAQPTRVPMPEPAPDQSVAEADEAPRPDADPIAFLAALESEYESLEQYTVVFERTERRGLGFFKAMRGPEEIRCWYRRKPFSIRMKWLDPDIKYGESSYVQGQFDDRVRFIPRHGLFGLPPTLTRVSLRTPVVWGEARYPVSDFGLERVLEKTLDVIEQAGDEAAVTYLGVESPDERPADAIRIEVPSRLSDTPRSELLFCRDTRLLIMTRLYNASGALEATYRYSQLDPNVSLSDADFLLDGEHPESHAMAQSISP